MKALICGYPKSGNSLLWKILYELFSRLDHFQSYSESFGLAQIARQLSFGYLTFPFASTYDNVHVTDDYNGLELEFPHPCCRRVRIPTSALQISSIIWSHDRPDQIERSLLATLPHRKIYLIRDGRDVITSQVHYVVATVSQRLRPEYRYRTSDEVYADLPLFSRWCREWSEHVEAYLAIAENDQAYRWARIDFDSMTNYKEQTIYRLADELELPKPTKRDVKAIQALTSFEQMKKTAPEHLRRKDSGGWRDEWTEEHLELFDKYAGTTLEVLGYR